MLRNHLREQRADAQRGGIEHHEADAQTAFDLAAKATRRVNELAERFDGFFRAAEERLAALRERDRRCRARQQAHVELFLKTAKLAAHGRLRHVQRFGCLGHAAEARDGHEGSKLANVHLILASCLRRGAYELYPGK